MIRKSPLLTLAAVGTLAFAGVAQAGPISYQISANGLTAAENAELAFLSYLQAGHTTEDFEKLGGFTGEKADGTTPPVSVNQQFLSISTSVGKFTSVTQGTGGACNDKGYSCAAGLAILDGTNNPFSGRFNTTPGAPAGTNWLDSFDAKDFLFEVATGNNAVGFFITDPNDAGGKFDFQTTDGSSYTLNISDIFGGRVGNKGVFYVSFISDLNIQSIRIVTNDPNDGFGVDGVTVGRVPEPGTLALLGLGLLGAGLMRRRG